MPKPFQNNITNHIWKAIISKMRVEDIPELLKCTCMKEVIELLQRLDKQGKLL